MEDCLNNMHVLEDETNGKILGVVCIEMLDENKIASIGPVAVHLDHQVYLLNSHIWSKTQNFVKSFHSFSELHVFQLNVKIELENTQRLILLFLIQSQFFHKTANY